jgi:hypothetical protein
LEKAAKLLREIAKSNKDPEIALEYYEQSSSIYREIGKEGDAEKISNAAYQKFLNAAKLMMSEATKMDDIYLAEKNFKTASEYALIGKDVKLSNECWIQSADQFNKAATAIHEPLEALEVFKHAIVNYKKGNSPEREHLVLADAADKFTKKGITIYKTHKSLVLALYNYDQAITIFRQINSEEKILSGEQRVQEICETIGITKESILQYLESQGMVPISLIPSEIEKGDDKEQDRSFVESDSEEFDRRPPVEEMLDAETPIKEVPQQISQETVVTESEDEIEFDVKAYFAKKSEEPSEPDQPVVPPTPEIFTQSEKIEYPEKVIEEIPPIPEHEPTTEVKNEVEFVVSQEDFQPELEATISGPIVDILRDQGYIDQDISTDEELLQVPEYQILSIIIRNHPISLDEIEAKTNISSISLVLSNLQADDLIVQTNDYRWTISQKVIDNI